MGRPERPIDPEAGPLQRFAFELRQVRQRAGSPSYRQLAKRAGYSSTALSEAAGGERFPTRDVTLVYVKVCDGDVPAWEARWRAVAVELELADEASATEDGKAPYLGLETFQPEDAERFFGRQDDIARLVAKLEGGRFLAVLGPSGCGKSSLVRAGVIPALARGAVAGGETWTPRILTPTARPLAVLAAQMVRLLPDEPMQATLDQLQTDERSLDLAVCMALAERDAGERLLLVIDQFEEIFTLCTDQAARVMFVANLCHAATVPGGRVIVLMAMRADFYHYCAAYPRLAALTADHQFLVCPLGPQGLREAIEQPAHRAGLELDAGLVETILADIADRPGTLPLLEYVLLELWRRRRKKALTLEAYVASGGVEHALGQRADAIYQGFTPIQQQVARRVLLRLIQPGEGTEDTRRRADMSELVTREEDTELEAVVGSMAGARLLTASRDEVSGAPVVEVSHEALIHGWSRLRGWIEEDRELLRAQRRLAEAAAEWEQSGRREGFLYGEARLVPWRERPTTDLNQRERDFLDASRRREERTRATRRRRARLVITGLSTALVIISTLAVLAIMSANHLADERELAFYRDLVTSAETQLEVDPELSILLARRALEFTPTAEAGAALRQAIVESRVRATLRGHDGAVLGVAFSPDGRRVASAGVDGKVRVWQSTGGGQPVVLSGHDGAINSVAFSPEGQRLASAGKDGKVRVWSLVDGSEPMVLSGHDGAVVGVAFSPDGRLLASAGGDGKVRVWPSAGGGEAVVLSGHDSAVLGVAFSPDGRLLASAGVDGKVRVWPMAGGGEAVVLSGHDSAVYGVAFSPDGQRVASAGDDGTVRVWQVAGGGEPIVLRGHKGVAADVAFSPDGRLLASAGGDGAVRVWEVAEGDPVVLSGHGDAVNGVAFSPDGQRVASAGRDGAVRVWPMAGGGEAVVLSGHDGPVYDVAFSPDGQLVASAGGDGKVWVWPMAGGGEAVVLSGHDGAVYGVAFSPDGQRVASAGADGKVRVWQVAAGGQPVVFSGHDDVVPSVAFSPDGQLVASAGADGKVRVWPVAGGGGAVVLSGHGGAVRDVAFSPDGQRLASASDDGTVRVWSVADVGGSAVVLRGHDGQVWSVAFSADGQRVASIGSDGTVRVWDPIDGASLVILRDHQDATTGVAFSPDGQRIASSSFDGTVRVWTCEVCGPIEEVLALAETRVTREMTDEECSSFLHQPCS
ncbi:MAG: AAA family ATPase [Egibacteraceae bacterium]